MLKVIDIAGVKNSGCVVALIMLVVVIIVTMYRIPMW